MRFTLDTNVLVYAVDSNAGSRHHIARELAERATQLDCVLTLQALAELFRVLTAKHRFLPSRAATIVQTWREALPVAAADESCLGDAIDAVIHHGWSFWDAMMWATAKSAGCRLLLTEDGQDGAALGGVTIVNPFAAQPSSLLAGILG
jgi:predicted nucleic acid-binding protein